MQRQIKIARFLIAVVLGWNLQCAIVFLVNPRGYVGAFGLAGMAGVQMVRALGLLFVMWNVPYVFALVNPVRNKTSLIEAVAMQAIGLAGETLILLLGGSYPALVEKTIMRFIFFGAVGLMLLLAALWLVWDHRGERIRTAR